MSKHENLLRTWDALETDHPMPTIARQRVIGERAMVSRVVLAKGCVVPKHAHENEQIACIVSGKIKFGLGEPETSDWREIVANGGDVLMLPANLPHSAEALEETVVLDVFSPPSETTGIDKR